VFSSGRGPKPGPFCRSRRPASFFLKEGTRFLSPPPVMSCSRLCSQSPASFSVGGFPEPLGAPRKGHGFRPRCFLGVSLLIPLPDVSFQPVELAIHVPVDSLGRPPVLAFSKSTPSLTTVLLFTSSASIVPPRITLSRTFVRVV